MILATVNKDNFLELHVSLDDTEKTREGQWIFTSTDLPIFQSISIILSLNPLLYLLFL